MSLVGDIIMELRQRIPDAPAVLNPASISSLAGATTTGGTFTPGSTIYVVATAIIPWGETIPSAQSSVVLTGSQNSVVATAGAAGMATTIKFYTGAASGSLLGSQSYPITTPGQNGQYLLGVVPPAGVSDVPPTRNTAYLPDTDGNFVGGFTAYRLLNRALQEMVRIAGGIIDVTGVQSQINQSMYRLDSPFYQFVNAWFDGYPMDVVQRSMMYLRNSAAGFSGILSYEQDGPQSVIQVWPQSNRTGGQNFLEAPLSDSANTFLVSDGTGFLSIGLAQIDQEIVAFSQVTAGGTVFQGVTRGLGGTRAVAHDRFAPVTELNIRMSGYRMCETYAVGDSALTIQVPQAWETPLVLHMLSQVRSMEQDDATAKSLQADFVQMADKIAKQSRLGKIKPRQIPIWGQNTSDARNVNGIGFGWLIN